MDRTPDPTRGLHGQQRLSLAGGVVAVFPGGYHVTTPAHLFGIDPPTDLADTPPTPAATP